MKLVPRITAGGSYDDNVYYTADEKTDSTIVTVSPSLDADYKTLTSNIHLKADWDVLRYLDESDLDRTDQYYQLSASHSIKDRLDTFADVKYDIDTTLNTYLQETGRATRQVERDFFEVGGGAAYNLTTISGISGSYRYQNASYDNDVYSDFDNHQASLYYYQFLKSQIDRLSLGPSYYHRNNDLNEVDSYSLDLGWNRQWSSITRSESSIGARYTQVKRDDGSEDDGWGAKARFEMTFEGIVTTTLIQYFHDLRTTVDGDDINVDNFYLAYQRSLTERFGLGIDGRLVFSYKLLDQQSDVNDARYYWIEPRLFYRLTQNLSLSLRYRYQNNVEFRDEGDVTRDRNIVWLQFSYGLPFLL